MMTRIETDASKTTTREGRLLAILMEHTCKNAVEVRALESDDSLIVIPVQGYRIMNTYRQRGVATIPLLVGSDTTVLNIWDMVGTKVSEQD